MLIICVFSIILSAKHCVVKNGHRIRTIFASAGTNKRDEYGQKRLIRKVVLYDSHNDDSFNRITDITLLKTSQPFKLGEYVKTIKWTNNIDYNKKVTIFGWGRTGPNSVPEFLQTKDLHLIPRKTCQELVAKTNIKIKDFDICTNESPCNGDSGGPLIQKVNGKQMLVGIVSYTYYGCTKPPTVFVSPGYFDAWIKKTIKQLK